MSLADEGDYKQIEQIIAAKKGNKDMGKLSSEVYTMIGKDFLSKMDKPYVASEIFALRLFRTIS